MKFFARIGVHNNALKEVQRPQSTGNQTVMYQAAPGSQTIKVSVEDNGLGVCGFWVGVVSAVAAVIQVITIFTVH
jgi:hypothetical protein